MFSSGRFAILDGMEQSMEFAYLDQGDERLLELADLPAGAGIAVTMHTTGYSLEDDEIVELAIVDLDGNRLFNQQVKPQNIEQWNASDASGGLAPNDVADCPELFQFEDEIRTLFDKAEVVVFEHQDFAVSLIEASWISLPDFRGVDLDGQFRMAHCVRDYPSEPAAAAGLKNIAAYYGIGCDGASLVDDAAALAACYRAFVKEHVEARDAKGAAYWDDRERRLAQQAQQDSTKDATAQMREKRLNQMNGLLWIAGAIIFASLIIQLYQRGGDASLMVIAGAVSVFCVIRGIANFRK